MTVTALVMAGGKGTRMTLNVEKPMLPVGGQPVIRLVLNALKKAKRVDSIVVAVSHHTPKTAQYLRSSNIKIVETPGREYVSDMSYAVKGLNLQTVLTVAADLPLLTGEIVDDILGRYFASGKSALAVVVPLETKSKLGMSLGYAFECGEKRVVPAGINVNDGCKIDESELEQEIYVMDKVEVAINVNTVEELVRAQEEFAKRIR